jgi:DNA segregation ATPase FtsK/SpoIIIE-like protein
MAAAEADAVNLESDVRRARAARDITLAEIEAQRAAWELQRDQMATALAAQQIAAGLGLVKSMGGQGAPELAALSGPARRDFADSAIRQAQDTLPAGPDWPQLVRLFDLLPNRRGDLKSIVLGITFDQAGRLQPIKVALEAMVHGALGGETGSGKSAFGYSLAYQIATAGQDARLVLADPAGVTWKTMAGLGERLMYPIITDDNELRHVLTDLLAETNRRTDEVFAPYPTVEKLSEYNALVEAKARLGYICAFIDELPDYMDNPQIQVLVKRLIRKSRKAGIFIFGMGTSWKATDLDTAIKRQFRTKVHFAASDPESSRVLLGDKAAASLRDPGRAFARLPFGPAASLVEIQAAYLGKDEALAELSQPSIFDLPVCKPETLAERAVYDAADRGASLREMYRIYHRLTRDTEPPESPSGQQLQLVKDLLAKRDKGAK